MNTTIEFYMFELVRVPWFQLKLSDFFGPNLPQKGISVSYDNISKKKDANV